MAAKGARSAARPSRLPLRDVDSPTGRAGQMAAQENITFTESVMTDDALDRRAALMAAVTVTDEVLERHNRSSVVIAVADIFYAWLRERKTLPASINITAGTPSKTG